MYQDWQEIPHFAGIDDDSLQRVKQTAHNHVYQAGATIFNEGEPCAGFHVILEGWCVFTRESEGRLHTLSLLRPVSTFNEWRLSMGAKSF